MDDLLAAAEVIVVGNGSPEFADARQRTRPEQKVIDLFRIGVERERVAASYTGICWQAACEKITRLCLEHRGEEVTQSVY